MQCYKTRLCKYHVAHGGRGCSKGSECTYAHSMAELCVPPNLLKTKICPDWKNRRCTKGAELCPFAHGERDLRSPVGCYKTSLCMHWKKGNCPARDHCRFAHDVSELRQRRLVTSPTSFLRNNSNDDQFEEVPSTYTPPPSFFPPAPTSPPPPPPISVVPYSPTETPALTLTPVLPAIPATHPYPTPIQSRCATPGAASESVTSFATSQTQPVTPKTHGRVNVVEEEGKGSAILERESTEGENENEQEHETEQEQEEASTVPERQLSGASGASSSVPPLQPVACWLIDACGSIAANRIPSSPPLTFVGMYAVSEDDLIRAQPRAYEE
ncbi:unnamed protein product [Vitrella brassicaformis CCMP3155]|uniref:C3H1-type domain-containing protein n=2 Tax=Vitrella brassicaformis TaxID=1169539 RepID=A0A0G4ESQ5_VITBC|nr:unnamed protein product [Vitrella brassicaformis CCMP3155]|eukprot:CEM00903.1 unnamed protein product [Vitrella brassicaformis CCMP3155]